MQTMNITNAEYFTFNVDNSMLLVGMTGTGKSYLLDRLITDMVNAHKPNTLQFILLDMTYGNFGYLRKEKSEFVKSYENNPEKGLNILDDMAQLAKERSKSNSSQPLIFICIEECDMAALDQARFDKAVMTINQNAKAANMKLVYSTSSPRVSVVSRELQDSFDLTLAGKLSSSYDYEMLGVPEPRPHDYYDFVVKQHTSN